MSPKKYIPHSIKKKLKQWFSFGGERLDFLHAGNAENRIGNLQRDESIFLYGLLKVVRPRLVVEFGFLDGYSSSVILSALDADAWLHSYDISGYAKDAAADFSKQHSNFVFHLKSQEAFDATDVAFQTIDFAFFDASHDLGKNISTFKKIAPLLTEEAIVMVHDTGLWQKKFMQPEHTEALKHTAHKWLDEERLAHQLDERKFINWILDNEPEFVTLSFGSAAVLRHGFTLVGKKRTLEV
jgi:predicted O-methyltransferase YrrM